MKIALEKVEPAQIEKRSFEIIGEELGERSFPKLHEPIIKRCIHTSADFDYADNLVFSEHAVETALTALKRGEAIITDTNMGKAGVNKKILQKLGGEIYCFMAEEDVAAAAKERKETRAVVSNAPTALVRLYELIQEKKISPSLVIGVPVGFVNVVQSKELIMEAGVPYIVARGRKGGSNVAAAVCNALIYQINREQ